jgi:hypothetical protein
MGCQTGVDGFFMDLIKPVMTQEPGWNRHTVPADPFEQPAGLPSGPGVIAIEGFIVVSRVVGTVEKPQIHSNKIYRKLGKLKFQKK